MPHPPLLPFLLAPLLLMDLPLSLHRKSLHLYACTLVSSSYAYA